MSQPEQPGPRHPAGAGRRQAATSRAILAALLASPAAWGAEVTFRQTPGRTEVSIDGQPFTNLYYGSDRAKPFLHPLRTVSGKVVTRGFPVEKIEGESTDHIWHHGLWYGHGDINGVDFWRDRGPETTGRIVARGQPKISGDTLALDCELVAPQKQILGTILQRFRFARLDRNYRVDVEMVVGAGRGTALQMGDTEEGALGFRFADKFREDRGGVLTNSDGLTGTRQIWGKRARWVDYSTTLQGQKVGVTILDHPGNPKYPTYWHARGYGLNAANPFGEHDFHKDKTRDGSLTIPAGGTLTFRYGVVIHEGELHPAEAERWAK